MGYPTRVYYTEKDKALMWDRWQKGESLNAIARHFGRSHSSVPASHAEDARSWPHCWRGVDPRAASRGRGPGGARPLGR